MQSSRGGSKCLLQEALPDLPELASSILDILSTCVLDCLMLMGTKRMASELDQLGLYSAVYQLVVTLFLIFLCLSLHTSKRGRMKVKAS
jgi:hypothetical protein